jgi:anti-sigma B factor antagonist
MTEENLEITQNVVDGVCKISLKGRVDSNTSDSLQEKLEAAIEEGNKNILLNMFHVVYLSSIGIRIILKTYKSLSEEGGSFKIEHPSETVKNVLGMVALKELLVTN